MPSPTPNHPQKRLKKVHSLCKIYPLLGSPKSVTWVVNSNFCKTTFFHTRILVRLSPSSSHGIQLENTQSLNWLLAEICNPKNSEDNKKKSLEIQKTWNKFLLSFWVFFSSSTVIDEKKLKTFISSSKKKKHDLIWIIHIYMVIKRTRRTKSDFLRRFISVEIFWRFFPSCYSSLGLATGWSPIRRPNLWIFNE